MALRLVISYNIAREIHGRLFTFYFPRADCSSQGEFVNDTVRSTCYLSPSQRIGIYTFTTMTAVVLNFGRAVLFYFICLRASYVLHNRMFSAVLRTFVQFFDNNSAGTLILILSNPLSEHSSSSPCIMYRSNFESLFQGYWVPG